VFAAGAGVSRGLQGFLPEPEGPFGIGTRVVPILDPVRVDFAAEIPRPRRVLAQLWYPTRLSGPLTPMIGDPNLPIALEAALGIPPVLGFLHSLGCHAQPSAPPISGVRPVLIFLSGMAGFRQSNLFQVEHLVSHGYIVVGVDVPGFSANVEFSDGAQTPVLPARIAAPLVEQSIRRQEDPPRIGAREYPEGIVAELADDVGAVIDSLAELSSRGVFTTVDLERIGIFGVSLGGITAAEVLRVDSRVTTGLMMDAPAPAAVAEEGLGGNAMWMTRNASSMRAERTRFGGWGEAEIAVHQSSLDTAVSKAPRAWRVDVNRLFHIDFTGAPYGSGALQQLVSGPLGGARAHAILNTVTKAFFDHTLAGAPAARLTAAVEALPEVAIAAAPESS